MAKNKSKITKVHNVINSVLLSIKLHPIAFLGLFFGILLIFWPLFFIQDIRGYPECVAYDFFPYSNGYSSDTFYSFIYYIQLPLAVIGALMFAFSLRFIRSKRFSVLSAIAGSIVIIGLTFIFYFFILIAGFDMSYHGCASKKDFFPDLMLFIDSSRKR